VLANVVVEESSGRRHAGSGFASRVVRVLRGGRCGVCDRTAVPATSLAVAIAVIYPRSAEPSTASTGIVLCTRDRQRLRLVAGTAVRSHRTQRPPARPVQRVTRSRCRHDGGRRLSFDDHIG